MNSEIILIGNICIYVLTLAYSIKYKKSKLGIYLLLLFTFVAFFGYMFFIQPGFWNTVHGSYMTIPPFAIVGGVHAKIIGQRERKEYQYGFKSNSDYLHLI